MLAFIFGFEKGFIIVFYFYTSKVVVSIRCLLLQLGVDKQFCL